MRQMNCSGILQEQDYLLNNFNHHPTTSQVAPAYEKTKSRVQELLVRSRSPSPKGRAGGSGRPGSAGRRPGSAGPGGRRPGSAGRGRSGRGGVSGSGGSASSTMKRAQSIPAGVVGQHTNITPDQMDRILSSMASMLGSLAQLKNVDQHHKGKIASRIIRIRDKFQNLVAQEQLESEGVTLPGKTRPGSQEPRKASRGGHPKKQLSFAGDERTPVRDQKTTGSSENSLIPGPKTLAIVSPGRHEKSAALGPAVMLLPSGFEELGREVKSPPADNGGTISVGGFGGDEQAALLVKKYSRGDLVKMEKQLRENADTLKQKADFLRDILAPPPSPDGPAPYEDDVTAPVPQRAIRRSPSQADINAAESSAKKIVSDMVSFVIESNVELGSPNLGDSLQGTSMDIDIPDDAETNAAATKMQAVHRGKRARKDVRQRKKEVVYVVV